MKKNFTMLFALMFLAACGGDEGPRSVMFAPDYPPTLAQFSDSLSTSARVLNSATSAVLSKRSDGVAMEDAWKFDIELLSDMPSDGANLEIEFQAGDDNKTALARVTVSVKSIEGQTLEDPGEAAYNFEIDDDQDGVFNINELLNGTNPQIADTDGDGVIDGLDAFPSIGTETADTDGDGTGDNTDSDIDGDGVLNDDELLLGTNVRLPDTDGDTIWDGEDICPLVVNQRQLDADGDGRGDDCDDDSDGDGLSDAREATLGTNRLVMDTDGDGLGDGYEVANGTSPTNSDTDGDGVQDKVDICPVDKDAEQGDIDEDGEGDVCDADKDGDVIENDADNCPEDKNEYQDNIDGDGFGDDCDVDADGDGVMNDDDNCPLAANPGQSATDGDNDGVPMNCDLDDTDAEVGLEAGAVFVDGEHGSDEARGRMAAPVATLSRGIALAVAQNLSVYVSAGTYDVSSLVVPKGISLFGGFENGADAGVRFSSRNERTENESHRTVISRSDIPSTLVLDADGVRISGFHITNGATSGFDAVDPAVIVEVVESSATFDRNTITGNANAANNVAVKVEGGMIRLTRNKIDGGGKDALGSTSNALWLDGGNLFATNNIFIGGNGRFSTGVDISGGTTLMVNNTIDARSGNAAVGASEGVGFTDASPKLANNLIITGTAPEQYALLCTGEEPAGTAAFRSNLFAFFSDDSAQTIVRDCDGVSYDDGEFTMGSATVDLNKVFGGANAASLIDANYTLVGGEANDGVDDALDPSASDYGAVIVDFSGAARPRGAGYDIGALEK